MTADTWEIRSRFAIEKPEQLRMTLTTTAQLRDWIDLHTHLDKIAMNEPKVAGIVYEFRRQIGEMVQQANRAFIATPETKP